ncbi:MAG: hypothetical protein L0229_26585, partial [Blastocatellia bacterium]|nr:hypothetical protein [Blastocatellia bacterium]
MATTKSKTGGAEKKAGKQRAVTAAASAASASGTRNLIAWIERLNPSRVILLICVLVFAAYANSLGGDFVFDDTEQIVENPDVRSWDNLARAFTTHVWAFRERADVLRVPVPPPYYRPIFTVMLTLEYKLFGLWPQGWHLVSLLLHILCSIGVYYVLLMLSGRNLVAAVSALLFAVWPVHAESVSWISGMTDPLFGVFFLASFYYYLKFRADRKSPRSRLGYRHFVLSLAAFALAAFSKETALSLVAVIFAYEFIEAIYNRSGDKRTSVGSISAHFMNAIKRALPFAGVAVLYLIPRYLVLGGLTWKNPQAHNGPLVDTFLTLPLVVMSYLAHLAWPVNLSIAYMTHFVTSAASLEFLLPAFALVLISGALIVYRKKIGREAWHALALMFIPLILV